MNRNFKFILLLLGALCVCAFQPNIVRAEDPLAVGPDVYSLSFENDRVRVMEINFNPAQKIVMHSHPDHFVYILEGGKLVLSYPDGTTKDFDGKPGDVVWINAETHAAENVGTTHVRGLVIELKEPKVPTLAVEKPAGVAATIDPNVVTVPPKPSKY